MVRFLIIGLIFFFSGFGVKAHEVQEQVLTISGQGEYQVEPDQATVSLGKQVDRSSPAQAQETVSRAVSEFSAALRSIGIKPTEIKTTQNSLYPIRDYKSKQQKIISHRASQQIEVKVTGKDRFALLGKAIDLAGEYGLNNVGGVNFGLSEPTKRKAYQEALKSASSNALENGRAILSALGLQYQSIQTINASYNQHHPRPMYRAKAAAYEMSADAAPVTNIQAGLSTVAANVTLGIGFED